MSALVLKIIACVAMLIDHIGFQYGIMAFRAIGRIAFPIFVYLLCNGYKHTSNRRRYALRLAVFAILSQIPFSLFCYGVYFQNHGNVMFTLLMAFLCIWSADELWNNPKLRWIFLLPTVIVFFAYHLGWMSSDYGAKGILLALVFYFFDGRSFSKRVLTAIGMLIAVYYKFILALAGGLAQYAFTMNFVMPQLSQWERYQAFSLLALIFIFGYNGKKGKYSGKILQYGFYAFYPLHQLVLWLIR